MDVGRLCYMIAASWVLWAAFSLNDNMPTCLSHLRVHLESGRMILHLWPWRHICLYILIIIAPKKNLPTGLPALLSKLLTYKFQYDRTIIWKIIFTALFHFCQKQENNKWNRYDFYSYSRFFLCIEEGKKERDSLKAMDM